MPVDPRRTVSDLEQLRALTADDHGAQRIAWTPTWLKARAWFQSKLAQLPVEHHLDAAGNSWTTLRGDSDQALILGSHLDSVPNGGWLDGALGVLAGFEVLRSLAEDYHGKPPVTIRLVDWADEEGARFGRSLFGSSAFAGTHTVEADRGRTDRDGVRLEDALRQCQIDVDRIGDAARERAHAGAYLELHIEQGPTLVARGLPAAVVTGIRGCKRFRNARCIGEYAHSGAVSRAYRHDAVAATVALLHHMETVWLRQEEAGADLVLTAGELFTDPAMHGPSKIAGETRFVLDVRSLSDATMDAVAAEARETAARVGAAYRVSIDLGATSDSPPAVMDSRLRSRLMSLLDRPFEMASGAGHDAAVFAQLGIPTAMIFVRNEHGSHNPDEAMSLEDFAVGTRTLLGLLTSFPF
jgi:beta-ureidopropionase / N-carbamoyl-L-amino-acid hydrolase